MPHSRLRPQPAEPRQRAERAGRRAEWAAALYLRCKGYRIIATRKKTPVGEIDIVARRGADLVFVEVKHRRTLADRDVALAALDTDRIARAAQWWHMEHPRSSMSPARFDVIVLLPWRWPEHIENAFFSR